MEEIQRLATEIKKCPLDQSDRIPPLIEKLQDQRRACTVKTELDLIFYGVARGLEIISDHRIFGLHLDDRLNELSEKIEKIEEREELEECEHFESGDSDTPEDYQALNIEFNYRVDEIKASIMQEFGENELSGLFMNNRKGYIQRYYSGWRILEKGNPAILKDIDAEEQEVLEEENPNI
jgi:hypothetical protein